ncbi:MAG TPA: GAF domain-containing protein [Pseudonocardiaceae bacterium]|nr:GAF domain-containing protein [Pseudonocardiaceae bacterium]
MDYDMEPRRFTPDDPHVEQRMARLHELNLESRPYRDFDELAAELANAAGAPDGYAMVNFIGRTEQYFAGLYTPGPTNGGQAAAVVASAEPGRVMDRDHGFCPHVVVRRKALVLEDVCEYPRFAGNPVVDELGIRSYLGAPLMDRNGMALGTICVVATEPHPWGHQGLATVKAMADRVVAHIHRGIG